MDQKITPKPIEPDRTKISEVGADRKSFSQFPGVQKKINLLFISLNQVTRSQNCQIQKPKLDPNEIYAVVILYDT